MVNKCGLHLIPLSCTQQDIYFDQLHHDGSPLYNVGGYIRLSCVDVEKIKRAHALLVENHEVFGLRIINQGDEIGQYVSSQRNTELPVIDFTGYKQPELRADLWLTALFETSIEVDDCELFRSYLLKLSKQSYRYIGFAHHLIMDGWGFANWAERLRDYYNAKTQSVDVDLWPGVIRSDIKYRSSKRYEQDQRYWSKYLAQLPPNPVMPQYGLHYKGSRSIPSGREIVSISVGRHSRFLSLAQTLDISVHQLYLSLVALYFSKAFDQKELVIGIPTHNRNGSAQKNMIGVFTSVSPLRFTVDPGKTLGEFCNSLSTCQKRNYRHQRYPIGQIARELGIGSERSALYSIGFNYLKLDSQLDLEGAVGDLVYLSHNHEPTPAMVTFWEYGHGRGIQIQLDYNLAYFSKKDSTLLLERLDWMLGRISAQDFDSIAQSKIDEMNIVSEDEKHFLVNILNNRISYYPKNVSIHELFENEVRNTPDHLAVAYGDTACTYKELNARANRLAHHLKELGIGEGPAGAEEFVGLCVNRSIDLLVGMLAILKAGGVYVPLDPNYPRSRLRYIMSDTAIRYLLLHSCFIDTIEPTAEICIVELDSDDCRRRLEKLPISNPAHRLLRCSDQLAYIVYTSGSTGQPKGVMIPHRGVVRLVKQPDFMRLEQSTRFLQAASTSFDAATLEIWGPLLNGGCSILYPGSHIDLLTLNRVIKKQKVTALWLTAGLFEQWSSQALDLPSLRYVLAGGDVLSPTAVARVQDQLVDATLINGYGPTENTTFTCCYTVPRTDTPVVEVPIGKVVSGTVAYVLNSELALAPTGCVGQLCVGGDGLFRGYLNLPELTAERLIDNPFSDSGKDRLYKTGDLARYLPDGNLAFVGRTDDQVKIRGFRVELGEIEYHLSGCEQVAMGMVMFREDQPGRKRLVAYVVTKEEDAAADSDVISQIRQHLCDKLPDYMLPSAFVILEKLPLTVNGKVDKKALPEPDSTPVLPGYVAPQTDTEHKLVHLVAELLGLEPDRISVTASFFDLGGDSLLAVNLVTAIRTALDCELGIKDVFESKSVRSIALRVDRSDRTFTKMPLMPASRQTDEHLMSFAQQRLWFIDRMQRGSVHYNMPAALRVQGEFDVIAAQKAFIRIIDRHEILRTVYLEKENTPVQVIRSDFAFEIKRYNLSKLTDKEKTLKVTEYIREDAVKSFDLSRDLMIRASYIFTKERDGILLFNMHHIASDGRSVALLIKEFVQQYQSVLNHLPDTLPTLGVQYMDYAYWQRNWLQGAGVESQLHFWDKQLEEIPAVHSLPLDYPRPGEKHHSGDVVVGRLPQELSRRLQQLARQYDVTLFMLLHAALGLVFSRHSHSNDIVVGAPVANRSVRELESLIGFFVNTLVLRIDTSHEKFPDYLNHIRRVNLDAQANQDVPFEHLVERLKVPRTASYTPLVQLLFSMDTNEASKLSLPNVSFTPLAAGDIVVKFDLDISVQITPDGLIVNWVYDRSLFQHDSVERFNEHLVRLLTNIAASPESRLCELNMLSEEEIHQQIRVLNSTAAEYPARSLIHELFEEQVRCNPAKVAIEYGTGQLTYEQLNESANQLAHHLRQVGVGASTCDADRAKSFVGVCLERSIEMVVSILAVLKSGGAYIALDPTYPSSRLQFILEDTGLKCLLTQSGISAWIKGDGEITVIKLDTDAYRKAIQRYPLSNPVRTAAQSCDNLAYVIYTSGSTGQPKGVSIRHRNTVAMLHWANTAYSETELSRVLASTSLNFDLSVFELFVPLCFGHQCILVKDALSLVESTVEVSLINTVPSAIAMLMERRTIPRDVEVINLAGEPLTARIVNGLLHDGACKKVCNLYGPSEDTTYSTCAVFTEPVEGVPSIGRVINNSQAYVLSDKLELLPLGATGQLYLGGEGLAQGYLNRAQLTHNRFVDNPYASGKVYATGDLVRYLPDGELMFIGRVDDQVKIRGFRIEPGEIEYQLNQCDLVSSCLVMTRKVQPDEKAMVAYVVPKNYVEAEKSELIEDLRRYLLESLPDYMSPSIITVLEGFPLTLNGKIDKKQLPVPVALQDKYVLPKTKTENMMLGLWGKLLNQETKNISVKTSFFELGGHSLLAVKLVGEMRTLFACEVGIKEVFDFSTIESLSATVDNRSEVPVRLRIEAIARTDNELPLSYAQQRLWLIDRMHYGGAQYNMSTAINVQGKFDVDIAEQAFIRIVARHEALRTVFAERKNGPVQIIRDEFTFKIKRLDLSRLRSKQQHERIRERAHDDIYKGFDLSRDLMIRATYLKLNSIEGVLLFCIHHIASDGWSIGLLTKEFVEQYRAISSKAGDPLPPLAIQYVDYACWQRHWLQGDVLDRQLKYWDKKLQDAPVAHSLQLDYPRPQEKHYLGDIVSAHLSLEVSRQLKEFAIKHNMTLFMLLHAALSLVLSRHSYSNDIVIGTPVANRPMKELEPLVGFFVNTLVLRTNCSFDNLSDYLRDVRQVNLDAQANQDVPFEHLVERLKVQRSTSHTPLVQVIFSMDTNEAAKLSLPDINFNPLASTDIIVKFDLEVSAQIDSEGLVLNWVFDKSLFRRERIEQFSEHLKRLLSCIVESSHSQLRELPMLSEEEIYYQTVVLNSSNTKYPKERLIHELFEEQVRCNPTKIAIDCENRQLTYEELNRSANRLAHYLRKQGVGTKAIDPQRRPYESTTPPGDLVGLCLAPSTNMIIAMLAILKAGGTYLPLDQRYPPDRLRFMMEDAELNYLITQSDIHRKIKLDAEINVTTLDSEIFRQEIQCYSILNPGSSPANDVAYVIYTSGTTGQPKGALVPHSGVVRLVVNPNFMELDRSTKFLQLSSTSFDAATLEIWGPLLNGGCCVVYSDPHIDLLSVNKLIRDCKVTALWLTAGLFEMWSEQTLELPDVGYVLAGGDILNPAAVIRVQSQLPGATVINGYGPTENTTFTCCQRIAPLNDTVNSLPIGKAVNGTRLYVMHTDGSIVPNGCVGELYVGGDGVFLGYINRPELTRDKLIRNPFTNDKNDYLYRTGDLVRYLPDSTLEFIGRVDNQVKIRGLRIEPGEIEYQLTRCERVKSNLVMVREDHPSQKVLVAYVVPHDPGNLPDAELIAELKAHLLEKLPKYMVPSAFVVLDEFPLTQNGKVDKQSLPVPDTFTSLGGYVLPRTETEKLMRDVWAGLLKQNVEALSVTDNFFDLGGHSLLATRLVAEIRSVFSCELNIKAIFELSTIASLSHLVDQQTMFSARLPIRAILRDNNKLPLSYAQQRLWFIDRMQGGSAHYNMPVAVRVEGQFDVDIAERALTRIVDRHETLRTVFAESESGSVQIIKRGFVFQVRRCDLSQLSSEEQCDRIPAFTHEDASKVFDLSQDLMIRATYLKLGDSEGILLFCMHHIASDGWSIGLLIREFVTQYEGVSGKVASPLPPLDVQYADYAHWQRNWLQGEVLEAQLCYWDKQLENVPAVHSLPLDYPRPRTKQHTGDRVTGGLSLEVSQRLQEVARQYDVTLFMLLHAALGIMLSRYSHSHDIVIGTPVANRQMKEVETLIGFFVNTLVLRTNSSFDTLYDYLRDVRQVNLDAQANQDVPFEHLVERLKVPRTASYTPLVQLLFSMDTNEASELSLPDVSFTPLATRDIVVKFDLEISAQVDSDGLIVNWVYDTSLFCRDSVERFNEHLVRLLNNIAVAPESRLCELDMLSEDEIHHQIRVLNSTAVEYPAQSSIHELFEEQVKRNPAKVAIEYGTGQLTYGQLNESANQLAHHLRQVGVGACACDADRAKSFVGVCLERSIEMVVSILAVLKSGGAYVPLDPACPLSRLQFMLEDTGLKCLLTQSGISIGIKDDSEITVIELDSDAYRQVAQRYPLSNPVQTAAQSWDNLAYIIHTSGSTGRPKGVPIRHRNTVAMLHWANTAYSDKELSRMLASTSLNFDLSVFELFVPLCFGHHCTLVKDALSLAESTVNVSLINTVPSAVKRLMEQRAIPGGVDVINLAGQPLTACIVNELLHDRACKKVCNLYGPSEDTTYSTCAVFTEPVKGTPSIGRVINNTQAYVLSDKLELLPLGATGQLYLGGDGLAQGYLNRKQLTHNRFVDNPYAGGKVYATGDLVRYMPDGDLMFIGRVDDQVKIRGRRIELSEVEYQLTKLEVVSSAQVLARSFSSRGKSLVAYLIIENRERGDGEGLLDSIKTHMRRNLPEYMRPTAYIIVAAWPLTSSGKIDRKALPDPGPEHFISQKYLAPQSDSEHALINIWSQLLSLDAEAISADANFFELGGHSLLLSRLLILVNDQWTVNLPLTTLFEYPVLTEMANRIDEWKLSSIAQDKLDTVALRSKLQTEETVI